jgi:hypothetical protein
MMFLHRAISRFVLQHNLVVAFDLGDSIVGNRRDRTLVPPNRLTFSGVSVFDVD